MNEIQNLIEKTINPPGILKKNRGALFLAIRDIAEIVRKDALRAFNAHFPYLADSKKLQEHGDALLIPHLLHDTETEYRERVAAAAFYHTKAGERAYITEQLEAHFGGRYILGDEFLRVFIKIMDLDDEDRQWVREFFDGILDPNIAFTAAEWFHFAETMTMAERLDITAGRVDMDIHESGFRYDGRFLCDQGKETLCNGRWTCDGSWTCGRFMPAKGTVFDTVLASIFPNGSLKCNGSFDCSGYAKIYYPMDIQMPVGPVDTYADKFTADVKTEPFKDQAVITAVCDGSFLCDGSNQASMADSMRLRVIRPLRCDGTRRPSCALCDGSIICNGSYTGFDGWYYSGDLVQEEVL
jgi:hypothetical protein